MGYVLNVFTGQLDPVGAAGSGANSTLSNLSNPTSVNASLVPQTTDTYNLGSTLSEWLNVYAKNLVVSNTGMFTGALSASNLSGTNTGDVTLGTPSGLTLSGQVLSLGTASGTTTGALLSSDWTTFNNKQNALGYTPENVANKGAASGYAPLDASSKIPVAYLPSVVLEYQGAWNPNTNTPTLADGSGTNGYVYYVSASKSGTVSGLTDPSMTNFQIGDLVIYSSSAGKYQLTTPAAGVSSVNGAQGVVTVNAINQLTGDLTAGPASGSASAAATLATVNANVGSFTNASITVNAKGLVTAASSGTSAVTSLSVTSANGFAGSFTAGQTPSLTLSTTVTGILYGNGTSVAAAVAGNFPTLNQSTTGTAANITATSNSTLTSLPSLALPYSQLSGTVPTWNQNTTGTAANVTATSNATLTTLSALSLPGSQVTGTVPAATTAGNITATSNSTLTTLSALSLPGSQVTGNISGNAAGFTGSLSGDVTGTQTSTAIAASTVSGKVLTGYAVGTNSAIAATDSILGAFEKTQGQINAINAYIPTGDISLTSFSALASQTAQPITGLSFANGSVRSFLAQVSVATSAGLYENFVINGIQRGSDWQIAYTSAGDSSGYTFSINTSGQVLYTSPAATATMLFRAQAT